MLNHARSILTGMKILIQQTWLQGHAVVVEDGVITAIIPSINMKDYLPAKQQTFPDDFYLIPGLMDLHIHGTHGHDVMDGSEQALKSISCALAAEGITGFLATTMSANNQHLETVLKNITACLDHKEGAAVLGIHLEGPFISKEKKGAQDVHHTQLPDIQLIEKWQHLAKGLIKIVTLAPELPGALTFIKTLHQLGIIASAGHTNATFAEMQAAIQAGCGHATHLFNAMRGLHQREPGAVTALLLSDKVMAELIVDGLHLHPSMIELAFRLKGKDQLLLVTDAMRAKCCPDGHYDLGGQMVTVQADKATLADGTLAGSTLRMPHALKNVIQFGPCSLAEAVTMAALNPARVLGVAERMGSIAVGKQADLVVLDAALEVVLTMREGREIFKIS